MKCQHLFSLNTDFICWRGLLTKLLAVPYEKQSDFLFSVIYYKKTWYLCEHETEKQQFERLNENDQNKKFQYWGHKFETYVSSGKTNDYINLIRERVIMSLILLKMNQTAKLKVAVLLIQMIIIQLLLEHDFNRIHLYMLVRKTLLR